MYMIFDHRIEGYLRHKSFLVWFILGRYDQIRPHVLAVQIYMLKLFAYMI